jgi:glycosyltransferase involved in cell wall biosynthesis
MKISVIIPLFNKKDTIKRALDSVLRQTCKADEIIVVNDGSKDGSEIIVTGYQDLRIKLISQVNQGVSAARNTGINIASNDWVAFLDADDEWLDDFLETIQGLHSEHPECNVLGTAYSVVDTEGHAKELVLNKMEYMCESGVFRNYFEVGACSSPPICSSAVCVRVDSLKDIGGFPVNLKSGEDLLTWAMLAQKNRIAYSKKRMAIYHHQRSNIGISRSRETLEDRMGDVLVANMANCRGDELEQYRKYIARWKKTKASIMIEIGENGHARKYIKESWNHSDEKLKLLMFMLMTLFPRRMSTVLYRVLR